MTHYASKSFWDCYFGLPKNVQQTADRNFELLKSNPHHPSLHFKLIGSYYSVRAGLRYRELGIAQNDNIIWFWIGSHSDYDNLIKG